MAPMGWLCQPPYKGNVGITVGAIHSMPLEASWVERSMTALDWYSGRNSCCMWAPALALCYAGGSVEAGCCSWKLLAILHVSSEELGCGCSTEHEGAGCIFQCIQHCLSGHQVSTAIHWYLSTRWFRGPQIYFPCIFLQQLSNPNSHTL